MTLKFNVPTLKPRNRPAMAACLRKAGRHGRGDVRQAAAREVRLALKHLERDPPMT